MRVTKCKLSKYHTLEVTYQQKQLDGIQNEVTIKSDAIVTDDLKEAFVALTPHLIAVCEQKVSDVYEATAFSISGDAEEEGLTIVGTKTLKDGKVLNLVMPFMKWNENYRNMRALGEVMSHLVDEVKQYLNGKAASKQTEIEF